MAETVMHEGMEIPAHIPESQRSKYVRLKKQQAEIKERIVKADTGKKASRLWVRGLFDAFLESLGNQMVAPLVKRIKALEDELAKVREQKGFTFADIYRGGYARGEQYKRGDVVTNSGNLWLCMKDSGHEPGVNDDWRLIVKKGRDGRGR